MNRRSFLISAAALAGAAAMPLRARAQTRPLAFADMHSHIGILGGRTSVRDAMSANGMLVVARKIVSDGPVIRRTPGKGIQQARQPESGELAAAFDRIVEFYRRVWAHSDATIGALPLDTIGEVPWWPEGHRDLSLHEAMVHVLSDLYRHAGHADVLRELLDGTTGADRRWPQLPQSDATWWASHRDKVEAAARGAAE